MKPADYLWGAIKEQDLPGLKRAVEARTQVWRKKPLGRGIDGALFYGDALAGAAIAHWPEGVAFLMEQSGRSVRTATLAVANFLDPARTQISQKIGALLGSRRDPQGEALNVLRCLKWEDGGRADAGRAFILDHTNAQPTTGGLWGLIFAASCSKTSTGSVKSLLERGMSAKLMDSHDVAVFHAQAPIHVEQAPLLFASGLDAHLSLIEGTPAWQRAAAEYLANQQMARLDENTGKAQGRGIFGRL